MISHSESHCLYPSFQNTSVSQKIISNIPELKRIGNDVTESIFVPKAILRQLMLAIMLETGIVSLHVTISLPIKMPIDIIIF